MSIQRTDDLMKSLYSEAQISFEGYLKSLKGNTDIGSYLNWYMEEHRIRTRDLISRSNISKGYIYQLLEGRRTNPSREYMVAICLACRMDLTTTQKALTIARCARLYPRIPWDAAIIYNINRSCYDLLEVNLFLEKYGLEPLNIRIG